MTTENKTSAKTKLQGLLACLRAQHWMYYGAHWQSRGTSGYQNHLLFERLYGALPAQFDGLAEKMVNYFGEDSVDNKTTMELALRKLQEWKGDGLVETAISSEKDLQGTIKSVYSDLKGTQAMTLGLDDYLMGLANDHETHLYLLEQLRSGQNGNEKQACDGYVEGLKKGTMTEKSAQVVEKLMGLLGKGKAAVGKAGKRYGELMSGSRLKGIVDAFPEAQGEINRLGQTGGFNGNQDAINSLFAHLLDAGDIEGRKVLAARLGTGAGLAGAGALGIHAMRDKEAAYRAGFETAMQKQAARGAQAKLGSADYGRAFGTAATAASKHPRFNKYMATGTGIAAALTAAGLYAHSKVKKNEK